MSAVINLGSAITPEPEPISLFDNDGGKKSQTTLLIEIGSRYPLFHCPNKDGYVQVGKQVLPIRSSDFKEQLSHEFFNLTGKGCNAKAIGDALSTLESIAKYQKNCHKVYIRVANLGDTVYLDIGGKDWRVIQIDKDGWQIVDESPVKFVRKRGFIELPTPTKGGELTKLKDYLNLSPVHLPLVYGFIFCALAGVSPYLILVLQGEQGTGKSTLCRVIRIFVDPSTVPLRNPPKDARDLLVSAMNTHCVVLDNLSGLSPELSDCICRLSTGGGIDLRALYTDSEQVLIDIQRPVMVNGIDDIATRPDLAERALILNLPVIEPDKRKPEKAFWTEFEKDKGGMFGAMLDAISAGLKNRDTVTLPTKPRMADAALWITACETGFKPERTFIESHTNNQNEAIELGIEASPVGAAIMTLMDNQDSWLGTPTDLLKELTGIAGETQARSKAWLQSTRGLKNAITRLKSSFRRMGITIDEGKSGNRFYCITKIVNKAPKPSDASKITADNTLKPSNSKANSQSGENEGWTDSEESRADKRPQAPKPDAEATTGNVGVARVRADRTLRTVKNHDWENADDVGRI
jgi:hypothetical protein